MLYITELHELFIEPDFTVVLKTERVMLGLRRISSSDSLIIIIHLLTSSTINNGKK